MARLLFGVSGGIAAYKVLEATRLAIKAGHAVRVIQTAGERAVRRDARRSRRSRAPRCWSASSSPTRPAGPIRASRSRSARRSATWRWSSGPQAYLIAPASANTIAKLAHGHADNLLTAAALAAACPVAVAPAMNNRMYLNAATQANLELLEGAGRDDHRPRRGRARLSRRARRRPPGRAAAAARGLRGAPHPSELGGDARARHCGRHPRADRQRALHRQPLLGEDGQRAGGAGGAPGGAGDAGRGQPLAARTRRRARGRRADRGRARAGVREGIRPRRRPRHGGGGGGLPAEPMPRRGS